MPALRKPWNTRAPEAAAAPGQNEQILRHLDVEGQKLGRCLVTESHPNELRARLVTARGIKSHSSVPKTESP